MLFHNVLSTAIQAVFEEQAESLALLIEESFRNAHAGNGSHNPRWIASASVSEILRVAEEH